MAWAVSDPREVPVVQPADVDAQSEALTIKDLKASVGKGLRLSSDDIAKTYFSDE